MKRKEVKRKKKTDSLLARIKEAQKEKDWGEVSCILDEATIDDKDDIAELKSIIPDLISHHDWVLRASTVEFIGAFGLRQFMNLVKFCLEDRNSVVRCYALMAYYDLRGAKALPVINELCETKDVGLRLTALALLYTETDDKVAFDKLIKILKRKRCHLNHRYAVMHLFDYYCEVKQQSKIFKLYEDILPDVPKSLGLAKDIKNTLKKWKLSK